VSNAAEPGGIAIPRGGVQVARLPGCDCRAAARSRANVLLIGDAPIVRQVVRTFWTYQMQAPLPTWRPGSLLLPDDAPVIVLYDVNLLSTAQQQALSVRLESTGSAPQIVSTSATPLFARVQAGQFCETLYYRLNTICIDLQEGNLHTGR